MAGILSAVDGRPLPSMPPYLQLSTVVALLTTVVKVLFTVPVTEALGQWKWNWFHRPGDAAAFHDFDAASRSPWTSGPLVQRVGPGHLASLGVLVYAVSGLVSMTTQEAVTYVTGMRPALGPAWVSSMRFWDAGSDYDINVGRSTSKQAINSAVLGGAYNLSRVWETARTAHCPLGDCTFPPFESAAICLQVADITASLRTRRVNVTDKENPWCISRDSPVFQAKVDATTVNKLPLGIRVSAPNGLSFTAPGLSTMYISPVNKSLTFKEDEGSYRAGILNLVVIWGDKAGDLDPIMVGYELLFHSCVNTYNVSVTDGIPTINITSSFSTPRKGQARQGGPVVCNGPGVECEMRNEDGELGLSDIGFTVAGNSFSISPRVRQSVASSINRHLSGCRVEVGNDITVSDSLGADLLSGLNQEERFSLFHNITASLNQLILQSWSGDNSVFVPGTGWARVTLIQVRWGWLGFLVVEIVLSSVFLAATIILTHRMGIKTWKNSSFAAILALDEESRLAIRTSVVSGRNDAVLLKLQDDQLAFVGNR